LRDRRSEGREPAPFELDPEKRKAGFSEKIMLNQKDKRRVRFNAVKTDARL
jgi:hypothetical protein